MSSQERGITKFNKTLVPVSGKEGDLSGTSEQFVSLEQITSKLRKVSVRQLILKSSGFSSGDWETAMRMFGHANNAGVKLDIELLVSFLQDNHGYETEVVANFIERLADAGIQPPQFVAGKGVVAYEVRSFERALEAGIEDKHGPTEALMIINSQNEEPESEVVVTFFTREGLNLNILSEQNQAAGMITEVAKDPNDPFAIFSQSKGEWIEVGSGSDKTNVINFPGSSDLEKAA